VSRQAWRLDAVAKVTGRATYANDVAQPNGLWAKVLRSPRPHARLLAIRTDAARAAPGVHAVLTGADIPSDVRVGRAVRDMPVLARDKVRFIGEKVAAVAAETAELAEQALKLIEVDYDDLPAVFDPLEAMRPGAPAIHDPDTVRAWAAPRQVVASYPNSVSLPTWGSPLDDVDQAIAAADHIVEHTFRTTNQHQGYLEPHAATVAIDAAGLVHMWASNKAPYLLMDYLRAGLGLSRDQLRLHILPLGGDFGGKGSVMDIPLLYFLAQATGRPVKMVMSYVEELTAGNPRHAATATVRSGVGADGRIGAQLMRVFFNSGAYAAFKPSPDATLPSIPFGGFGAYDIAVSRLEAHMIYTNSVPGGHMRGPGEAQTAYALECHMELTARELGFDPIEFRRLNATSKPRHLRDGSPGPPARAQEVLRAAADAIGWGTPKPPHVGRGVALLEYSTIPGIYSANLAVAPDGQVTIFTAIVENGVGSHTAFREIVADAFGISTEQVSLVATTDGVGYDRGVGGARITRLLGTILETLVPKLQARLRDAVAAEFGAQPSLVDVVPGGFRLPDGRSISLAESASLHAQPLVETLTYPATARDNATVYLCEAAEVAIDVETGRVVPRRLVSVHEVGRIIRPDLHDAQIQGGVAQGLGYALMEGLNLEAGRVTNVNLHEYKMPVQTDMPPLDIVLLPADPDLGITPIGEGPSVGVAPAIANAIVDALGRPHAFDLPLRPEAVLRAVKTGRR
jgi:carbon-monoxide dehydrogenase large subunit